MNSQELNILNLILFQTETPQTKKGKECTYSSVANVDTVYIVKNLSQNQALQSSIDQVANHVIDSSSCLQINGVDVNQANCLSDIKTDLNQAYTKLSPLPFGWDLSDPWKKQFSPLNWESIITAIIGWLLTGIAITMGAPFWFDLLSNIINVRNTGKKVNRN